MSGNVCSYINCRYSSKKLPGLRKFFFPVKEPERLKKWIALCGNSSLEDLDLDRLKHRFLCHKHFEPELMRSNKLLRGSLPFDHSETASWASELRKTYSKFPNIQQKEKSVKDAANNLVLPNNTLLHGPQVDHGYVKPKQDGDNMTAKSLSPAKVSKKNIVINDPRVVRKVSKVHHSDDKFTGASNLKIVGESPSSGKVVKKRVIITDPVAVKKILAVLHTSQRPKSGTYSKFSTTQKEDGSCEKVTVVEKISQCKLTSSNASTSRDIPSKDSFEETSQDGDNTNEKSPSVKRAKKRVLDDPDTVKEILSSLYSFQQSSSSSTPKSKTNSKSPKGRVTKEERTVKCKSVKSNVPKSRKNIPQRRSSRTCVLNRNSKSSPSQEIDETKENQTTPKKNVKRKAYTCEGSPPKKILFKQNPSNTLPPAAPATAESSDNLETESTNKEATSAQGVLERKHSTCESFTQTRIQDSKAPAVFASISGGSVSKIDPRFSELPADMPASASELAIFSESSDDIPTSTSEIEIVSEPPVDIPTSTSEIEIFSEPPVDIPTSSSEIEIFSEPPVDIPTSSSEIEIFSEPPVDIPTSSSEIEIFSEPPVEIPTSTSKIEIFSEPPVDIPTSSSEIEIFPKPSADISAYSSEIGGIFSELPADISASSSEIGGIFSELPADISASSSEIGGIFSELPADISASSSEIGGIFSELPSDISSSSSEIDGIFSEPSADIVTSVTKTVSTSSVCEKMSGQIEETIPAKYIVREQSLSIDDADAPSLNVMTSSDEAYYVVIIVEPQTDSKSPAKEERNENC